MYKNNDMPEIIYTKALIISNNNFILLSNVNNIEEYRDKLYCINEICNNEIEFFMLSDYTSFNIIDNVLEFISTNRFKYKDKEATSLANQIIVNINRVRALSDDLKKPFLINYVLENNNLRCLEIDNLDELAISMVLDAAVYFDCLDDFYEKSDNYNDLIYGSINYIINTFSTNLKEMNFNMMLKRQTDELRSKSNNHKLNSNLKTLKKSLNYKEYE